ANSTRRRATGKNQNHILSEAGDLRFHLRLCAVADPDHGDHCADTDDDAKRSQHRTHFVSAQRAVGDVKCGRDSHLFVTSLKTLHGYMGVRCALAAASRLWPRPTILLNLGRCLEALRDQMIVEDNSVPHDDVAPPV